MHPEHEDGHIACDIVHTDTNSSYRALSYTWGALDGYGHLVLIQGRYSHIRHNLWTFLQYARVHHPRRAIWIDAISINQDDVEERNHQVHMMSEVYLRTDEVLVWLGPQADSLVVYTMRKMHAYRNPSGGLLGLSTGIKSSADADFWRRFLRICEADYWTRVWVLQELLQPPNGRIIQGAYSVSFGDFMATSQRLNNSLLRRYMGLFQLGPQRRESFNLYMAHIQQLWQFRAAPLWTSHRNTINEFPQGWSTFARNRFCSDICDRVYGLLPMMAHGLEMRVDYRLNLFELMLETLWLEHGTQYALGGVLLDLIEILYITPLSIMFYSKCHVTRWAPGAGEVVQRAHLDAVRSPEDESLWLREMGRPKWRRLRLRDIGSTGHERMELPGSSQCPWNLQFTLAKICISDSRLQLDLPSLQRIPKHRT